MGAEVLDHPFDTLAVVCALAALAVGRDDGRHCTHTPLSLSLPPSLPLCVCVW